MVDERFRGLEVFQFLFGIECRRRYAKGSLYVGGTLVIQDARVALEDVGIGVLEHPPCGVADVSALHQDPTVPIKRDVGAIEWGVRIDVAVEAAIDGVPLHQLLFDQETGDAIALPHPVSGGDSELLFEDLCACFGLEDGIRVDPGLRLFAFVHTAILGTPYVSV